MHAEETDIHAVYFLKCKKCFGSVGETLHHLARVHEPVQRRGAVRLRRLYTSFYVETILPGLHARLHLHRFVRAGDHSHKHLPGLWVVLPLQVLIHSVLDVCPQPRGLQPFTHTHTHFIGLTIGRGRGGSLTFKCHVHVWICVTYFWLKTCSPFLFCHTSSDSCHR